MHDRSADTGATFADSTNVEFADDYDRGKIIRGDEYLDSAAAARLRG